MTEITCQSLKIQIGYVIKRKITEKIQNKCRLLATAGSLEFMRLDVLCHEAIVFQISFRTVGE